MTDDELAIPDFDHVPSGALRERIVALDRTQLQALLDHERAHGDRLPVVEVLRHRIEAVDGGAEPHGTVPEHLPEVQAGVAPGGVTPATSGPPVNPPSHGDPTNPAMPR